MKRFVLVIVSVFAIIVVAAMVGLLVLGYSFNQAMRPQIDPRLYKEIAAKRIERSQRYRFLPPEVPVDAYKVAFFHEPKFGQGSDIVILRVALPESQIKETLESLTSSGRKEITDFGDVPKPHALPGFGMTKPSGENKFEGISELPTDFRIFLFESDLDDIHKHFNHNFLAFTAVSTQRGEVVYYVDSW
jgi:hypothetical protein